MIPYGRQSIDSEDELSVLEALSRDFLTTGPLVESFETSLCRYTSTPTSVVNSGTSALHAAYFAIGLGPGDEIITPPITFIATQAMAIHLGAKIVFADIDRSTGLISVQSIKEKITERTKAIVLVDYAGQPCDIDGVKALIQGLDIKIIEDAAHSLGSEYKGIKVGGLVDITTFSFYPTKNITTCEGGAISSNNSNLIQRAKEFSRQGLIRDPQRFLIQDEGSWHQEVHDLGFNYRLSDIQCALGISQLKKIDIFKKKRSDVFRKYKEYIPPLGVGTVGEMSYANPMWHLFPIFVPKESRALIFDYLKSKEIGVQVNYIPAYHHPVFHETLVNREEFPESEAFYSQEISIPMHTNLNDTDIDKICTRIEEAIKLFS